MAGVQAALDSPFTGVGYGGFDLAKNAHVAKHAPNRGTRQVTSHVTLLTTLVEEGFIGLGLAAAAWVATGYSLLREVPAD